MKGLLLSFVKHHRLLVTIIIVGFLLRILNPFFGSPILYVVPDEVSNYVSAALMLAQKTPFSLTSQYTVLGSYLQIPFFLLAFVVMLITKRVNNLSELEFFFLTHEGYFLFIPRILSAIFGNLSILIIYQIAKTIFPKDKRIHFWSTLFFSLSLNHIQLSHLGKPWSVSLFFYLLSIFYLVKSTIQPNNKVRSILLSSLFIAISYGFLQIAFYAFLLFIITRVLSTKNQPIICKENAISIISAIGVIFSALIFNHLTVYKPSLDFLFKFDPTRIGSLLTTIQYTVVNNSIVFFLKQFITTEPVLFVFTLIALTRKQFWKLPFIGITIYLLTYFIIMSFLFWEASRYLLPLTIILPLYASTTIVNIENYIESVRIKYIFGTIVVIIAGFLPILWNIRFINQPTFMQAKQWIEEEIKPDTLIASTSIRFSPFVPALESINIMQSVQPDSYSGLKKFLRRDYYPDNVRQILYLEKLSTTNNIDEIKSIIYRYKPHYITDYYWDPEKRLLNKVKDANFKLIMQFSPLHKDLPQRPISNLYSTMTNPNALTLLLLVERAGSYIDIIYVKY